jgi:hypothetical protein
MFKCLMIGIGLALIAAACTVPSAPTGSTSEDSPASEILASYSSWEHLFELPRNVSMELMLLCRMVTGDEQAFLESEHAQFSIQLYANPAALNTIKLEGARTFPEGSVIVKEKWAEAANRTNTAAAIEPAGLGIMVKRAAGFDAQGGDWQYLYVDEKGEVTLDQAQLQHCRACHMASLERDAVFYPSVLKP